MHLWDDFIVLKRASWRHVAPLFLVCVLAGCSHAPQERDVSVSELVKKINDAGTRGQQFRTSAIVTYIDPEWRVLFVQNPSAAIYVNLPSGAVAESGDRVEITGVLSGHGTGLDQVKVSVLSKNNAMPAAVAVSSYSDLPYALSSLVAVQGTVRWAGVKRGRPAIEISSGDTPLVAYLRTALIEDLPPLGSKVNVIGVAAADVESNGRLSGTKLFVPSAQYVRVLKRGPSDPFSLPVRALADLNKVSAGMLVHVSGKISQEQPGAAITDGKLTVPLNLRGVFQGASAEVAGFWTGHSVDDALARPLSPSADHPSAVSPALDGDIVHLSQLKRLSEAEASAHKRVTVRAVVTYFDPDWHLLFVQDDTAAAFVSLGDLEPQLRPGDLIDISGVSHLGDFAPVIAEPKVILVGRSPLPAPFRADLFQGSLPAADSRWCTFRGVVHTAQEQGAHTILKIGAGQNEVTVQLPMPIHGDALVDQEVSVTGVFGVLFNDRRQAIGHQIFVPSPDFLAV